MGRSRYKVVDDELPHFVTPTVLHWIPVFTRPATVSILLDSLKHFTNEGFKLYAFVILENHMQLVAQSKQLGRDLTRFKSYTARELLAYLRQHNVVRILNQLAFYKKVHKIDRAYQCWQESYHPEWIQKQ